MQVNTGNEPRLDAAHYVAKRDGALLDYLRTCQDERREGLFLGPGHYRALWDAGLLEPEITSVRIMYNSARPDEHYSVIDRDTVTGIEGEAHSGRPGLHPVEEVIPHSEVMFEVYMWKR